MSNKIFLLEIVVRIGPVGIDNPIGNGRKVNNVENIWNPAHPDQYKCVPAPWKIQIVQ